MTKLLQINVEANFGSTGRIASGIGDLVIDKGWESYIAFGRKHHDCSSQLIPIGNIWEQGMHLLQTRLLDRHGLGSKRGTKNLINWIETHKPDLIHIHNLHGYYLNYKILFEYLEHKDIPIVYTLHDCWILTGHCTHFEAIDCRKWQKECHNCPQKSVYPTSLLKDRSQKNHQDKKKSYTKPKNIHFVTVSKWLTHVFSKSYLAQKPVSTIHNGLDTNQFEPNTDPKWIQGHGLAGKKIILGVASVWEGNKGLSDFVKLSQIIPQDYQVVLIGLSPKQLKNLPASIYGLARTSSINELVKWYSMADVYVNASIEESFGMTTVEAMACGTPVVVYPSTANPELVVEQVGRVAKNLSVEALKEAIDQVMGQPKDQYSTQCRQHVIEKFDKEQRFMDYYSLYLNLLSTDQNERKPK
ncbi:glycosyltransferase [Sediminicola luteus]|uniref:Glycosyl transferase n=1 Tax=Sediminicola luteus TaxID=319238 RepID=A0A2A4G0T1_9FLAO|nr:glycosyltransferase [Sediminicola luteus]PCE62599.1 hypothetical protein B7P33_18375 [Sediminicola luteus]